VEQVVDGMQEGVVVQEDIEILIQQKLSGGGGSSETSLALVQGTTYTITVGSGGAGATSGSVKGSSGLDSLISGTGITTITSTGGWWW
jgi:hypothetical protein